MRSWRRVLTTAFFVVAVGLLAWSVAARWDEVRQALPRLDPRLMAASFALAVVGLVAQMLSWRALLDGTGDGPPLAGAAKVYFAGQLGKYLPGGAWTVLAQAELGRRYRVSRTRSAVVALGALLVLLVTSAVATALSLVTWSSASLGRYWWVLAVVPVGVAALLPPVFNRAVALLQRLLRRPDAGMRLGGRALAASVAWALVQWVLLGLHVAVLAVDLGAPPRRAVPLAVGAYALAWAVGFLVVLAPAGTGPREAALVLALAPVLSSTDALVVALASRVIMVVADALVAGLGAAWARHEGIGAAGPGNRSGG